MGRHGAASRRRILTRILLGSCTRCNRLQTLASTPGSESRDYKGLVFWEDGGVVICFLMDYIELNADYRHLGRLGGRMETIDRSRRQKWASQTEDTVRKLHEQGLAWGDGKADNLLLDQNDDLWVADLGEAVPKVGSTTVYGMARKVIYRPYKGYVTFTTVVSP